MSIRVQRSGAGRRRGVAIVGMVILLVVLDAIIVALVIGSGRDQRLTVHRVETVESFYAAEAGMNMALRELWECRDEDGDGAVGSISDDSPVNDANDPTVGHAQVVVSRADDCPASPVLTLTSVGRLGESRRAISSTLDIR